MAMIPSAPFHFNDVAGRTTTVFSDEFLLSRILLRLASFGAQDVACSTCVARSWRAAAEENSVWQRLCRWNFPATADLFVDVESMKFKRLYVQLAFPRTHYKYLTAPPEPESPCSVIHMRSLDERVDTRSFPDLWNYQFLVRITEHSPESTVVMFDGCLDGGACLIQEKAPWIRTPTHRRMVWRVPLSPSSVARATIESRADVVAFLDSLRTGIGMCPKEQWHISITAFRRHDQRCQMLMDCLVADDCEPSSFVDGYEQLEFGNRHDTTLLPVLDAAKLSEYGKVLEAESGARWFIADRAEPRPVGYSLPDVWFKAALLPHLKGPGVIDWDLELFLACDGFEATSDGTSWTGAFLEGTLSHKLVLRALNEALSKPKN